MNVELEKNYPLDYSATDAWAVLNNIEAVATCMPGAEITEVVDANNYKGKVNIRLGPVKMEFNGDISVQSIDEDNQQIQLIAEGTDKKGTSSASMNLTANIEAGTASSSALLGDAKVVVNGKLASFGQRMMAQVSDQILEQFADNFRAKIGENASQNTDAVADSDEQPADQPAESSEAIQLESNPTTNTSSNEINGFKFILQTITGLISGLFKRK